MNSPPQAQLESATREDLAGLVERVTFHNAENGFCVLRIKAPARRELITVIRASMRFPEFSANKSASRTRAGAMPRLHRNFVPSIATVRP